jgi:hypothetical protein
MEQCDIVIIQIQASGRCSSPSNAPLGRWRGKRAKRALASPARSADDLLFSLTFGLARLLHMRMEWLHGWKMRALASLTLIYSSLGDEVIYVNSI